MRATLVRALAVLATAAAVLVWPRAITRAPVVVTADAEVTTTTAAVEPPSSTTTTTAPTTTAPPPPTAPPSTVPAAPATAPVDEPAPVEAPPPPPPPAFDALGAVDAALDAVVPGAWRAAVPYTTAIIDGSTSWAATTGAILVPLGFARQGGTFLRVDVAHEWGHLVAYWYGAQTYLGAPPTGFPYSGPMIEEQWADCVAEVLTGAVMPSHGLGACPAEARRFTSAFLAAGPR